MFKCFFPLNTIGQYNHDSNDHQMIFVCLKIMIIDDQPSLVRTFFASSIEG